MNPERLRAQLRSALRRDLWVSLGPAVVLVAVAFAVTAHFIQPAPPPSLTLAVAPDEGGSSYFAKRYKELLARNGIELKVRTTSGTADNLRLLADPDSGVDAAFVQGGIHANRAGAEDADEGPIVSLGSLAWLPLWVYYRGEPLDDPRGLQGKRIAVGKEGGATRSLAVDLLTLAGVAGPPTQLMPLERDAALAQLQAGQVDAAFVVAPAEAPAIQKAAQMQGIRLLDFARAEAYARRLPWLTRVVLPRGVFDLAQDVPPHDVAVVAPTANLLAKRSLHPALAYLLLRAASQVHGRPGLLQTSVKFPTSGETGFPASVEAQRYYQSGLPLSQRYLPFWAASLVERLWLLLLPLLAVLVPVLRVVPPLYRWRVKSRIYRWYARLKEVELHLEDHPDPQALAAMLVRLDEIEYAVHHIPTPLAYAENLYSFREHVDLLRRRVDQHLRAATAEPGPTRKAG